VKSTDQPLRVTLIHVPAEDARQNWNEALDLLADWIANEMLEEARQEVAAQLGVSPDAVAPAPNDTAQVARAHGQRLLGASS
jgi:hypothetical protein